MNSIDEDMHEELIKLLEELIQVIEKMRESEKDYLLMQNEEEAKEWLNFVKEHVDKEGLKSLEKEISDRFFYKFDVQIAISEDDNKRTELMKTYIMKSNEFLKR